MIRTVPDTGNEEIELYIRTYYSLLRSTDAIKIEALIETHAATDSSLHVHAREPRADISALVYSALRLPPVMHKAKLFVLGQIIEDFVRAGFGAVEEWERVYAPGRRRRTHFNGVDTIATMIASRSDIDDLIPILTAFQMEWNKIHEMVKLSPDAIDVILRREVTSLDVVATVLGVETGDIWRLKDALQDLFWIYLNAIVDRKIDLSLQLLSGSQVNYRKAASRWWGNLSRACEEYGINVQERPVYFVSSNTHSISNLVSGYSLDIEQDLLAFMTRGTRASLVSEWEAVPDDHSRANFLYYLLKQYQSANPHSIHEMRVAEENVGFYRVQAKHGFDTEAQILHLEALDVARLDSRITEGLDVGALRKSDALVINIDYPLGLAAFELLTRVGEGCAKTLGMYIMGKAATLNGRIGDVMLVNVVHDEHSKNTYLFQNCFQSHHLVPYLTYGMLLDNQKALTARGTFLQNRTFMEVFYREGYTVLEMEAGPYLSAVYEMIRPVRHPYNEIVNLYAARFDVGMIHYASDTPYSKGHNLGAGSLGYRGIDSTYASAIAIMRRIFDQEIKRIS